MKKSNLLKATLFGMLSAFLAIISMFFLWSSIGLVLTLFATISALIAIAELGVEIGMLSFMVILVQTGFTLTNLMPDAPVINYKQGVLVSGVISMMTLFYGLTVAVVKAKKMKSTNALICIFILGISFALGSCNQTPPKQFCSELSQDCELSKDFVMIKIIANNGNGIDAYGTVLHTGEWYLHSTKSGAVLPFEWNGMESSNVTPPELEKVLAGENPVSILSRIKKFKVDTLTNFGVRHEGGIEGYTQIITKVILLETDGYFDVFNDGKGRRVTFRSQKETAENPVTE